MALKAILDNLDNVPDALKTEYVGKNGKFELQVEGMKTQADVDRVAEALRKEKNDFTTFKTQFAPLAGKNVEDIVAILDRVPELEAAAAGKIDDTKLNEMVETRLKSRLAPVERERDQLRTQVSEKDKMIGEFQGKEKNRTIQDAVRKAGTAAKILPSAMEDALILAERHFDVEEVTGRVVTKDGIGVTPGLEPSSWFTDMGKSREHWWGQSVGGGAGGNRGGGGATTNPFSAENWNMTEQGKLVKEDAAKADQFARAAGTTVGGPKPAAKK